MTMNTMNYLDPITAIVSEEGYKFFYSLGHQEIFSTNDPLKGWDGKYNGIFIS